MGTAKNVCSTCHVYQSQLFEESPHKAAFEAAVPLAFAGGFIIEVHCLPPMPRYALHPQIVAVSKRFARSTASAKRPARSHSRRPAISAKSNGKAQSSRGNSRRQSLAV